MEDIARDIRRKREDHYFQKQEQKRLEEMQRRSARDAETVRLMEVLGGQDRETVRELMDAGFDVETFRLLYFAPLVQVAWSDGDVSRQEREKVLEIGNLHGIKTGSAAQNRLMAWLTERPSDRFFQACVRGIKAMLRQRPPKEEEALRRDLAWFCTQIASASGGFLGLVPRISKEEESVLAQLVAELDARHHAALDRVTEELSR